MKASSHSARAHDGTLDSSDDNGEADGHENGVKGQEEEDER